MDFRKTFDKIPEEFEVYRPRYCEELFENTADEYISYISTHCAHITLEEPYKSAYYSGIKKVIMSNNNQIKIIDTIPLYLVQKPL